MNRLRRITPSPAMVVACIALTVALAGTSYAAIKLPKNSVGAKQLKRNAVTGPKIKANAVTGAKIPNNSLTGADVNEGSLAQVPSAATATNATNATNANTLGGIAATGFLLSARDGGGALAGANVTAAGTVNAHFNRFGGAPTINRLSEGLFILTFPGLEGRLLSSTVVHSATLAGLQGEIRVASSSGNPFVFTYDSAGVLADRSFFYTVFGTNVAP